MNETFKVVIYEGPDRNFFRLTSDLEGEGIVREEVLEAERAVPFVLFVCCRGAQSTLSGTS